MPEFQVTGDVIKHIVGIMTTHLGALNQDLTSEYSEAPDTAFSLAMGAAIATTLNSFSDPDQKANVVEAMNGMLVQLRQPWRLVPIV